jgi:hypothetical protein
MITCTDKLILDDHQHNQIVENSNHDQMELRQVGSDLYSIVHRDTAVREG